MKALGGAKLKLVLLDSGDTTEKAKNAAQRMVAQETDLVAATGSYSQLLHARRHRGDRARRAAGADAVLLGPDHLARLQVRLPDLARRPARRPSSRCPVIVKLAEAATGRSAEDGRHHHDNTAASISSVKPMRSGC